MNTQTTTFSYEFEGDLTSQRAYHLKNQLSKIISQGNLSLSLNFWNTQEADIVGVNALAITQKVLKDMNGKMSMILKKGSQLDLLLHLTKFNKIFTIFYME